MRAVTVSERPDLTEPAWERTKDVLPEYNNHGDVLNAYWPRLTEERPEFQFHLVGDGDEILARARSLPVRWDGTVGDLPAGIDGAIARGFDEGGANVLCALVIMIPRRSPGPRPQRARGRGDARDRRRHGLTVADRSRPPELEGALPARADRALRTWRRPTGCLFDPWMRVHDAAGATVLKPEPRVATDHGHRRRVGGVDRDGVPREPATTGSRAGSRRSTVDREPTAGATGSRTSWMRHALKGSRESPPPSCRGSGLHAD